MLRGGWNLGSCFNSIPGDLKVSVIQMDNKVVMVNGYNLNTQIEFFLPSLGNNRHQDLCYHKPIYTITSP